MSDSAPSQERSMRKWLTGEWPVEKTTAHRRLIVHYLATLGGPRNP